MNKPPYLKILVADRQSIFCKGFKAYFNRKRGYTIEKAHCSSELFGKITADKYNMLYVQDKLPELNLHAAVPLIIAQQPEKIIVHTDREDAEYIRALRKIGIHGLMSQYADESLIPLSIETVYAKLFYLCPAMDEILLNNGIPIELDKPKILEANLSSRQHETLTGQLQGKSRAQIANKMGIKVDTLRNHIKSMRKKLDKVGLLGILPDVDEKNKKDKKYKK